MEYEYITVESRGSSPYDLVITHKDLNTAKKYATNFIKKSQKVRIYKLVEDFLER